MLIFDDKITHANFQNELEEPVKPGSKVPSTSVLIGFLMSMFVLVAPSENNIGYTPANYAAELEFYAKSLASTYGLDKVPFIYAQPANSLVEGITTPEIPGSHNIMFTSWPKSLKDLAVGMAKKVK